MTPGGRTHGRTVSESLDACAFRRDRLQLAATRVGKFFRRQRTFILATATTIALLTGAFCYLVAPLYTAKASIVVERSRNPLLRNEKERPVTSVELANDLRDIIRSRPVIEEVVDRIRPYEGARQSRLRESFARTLDRLGIWTAIPLRERYIRRWSKTLTVESDGDFVSISMSDENPALAMAVINAAVEIQQRRYLDLLRASHGSHLRLDLYQRAQSEVAALRALLLKANTPVMANSVGYATALSQLRSVRQRIASLDAQTIAMQIGLGPNHPETLTARQMSDEMREALTALAMEVRTLERSATASEETQILIHTYNEILDSARKELEKARLLEKSDTRTVSLRIAEYAHMPIAPDYSRLMRLLIGICGGIVFALSVATIRDRLSTRLSSPGEVESILRVPVRGGLARSRRLARALQRPLPS